MVGPQVIMDMLPPGDYEVGLWKICDDDFAMMVVAHGTTLLSLCMTHFAGYGVEAHSGDRGDQQPCNELLSVAQELTPHGCPHKWRKVQRTGGEACQRGTRQNCGAGQPNGG